MFLRRAQLASILGVVIGVSVLCGTGFAYAQMPDIDINVPTPEIDIDVNANTNIPSASEINCEIFAQLMANGHPIPQGFDASGCEGGGGGGGGGGTTPACADGVDNDGDGLVDSADPGCSSATDTDESNSSGGGGGGGNGGGSGGGSGGGNSGGPAPACEDNVDNDGDGLKDMNDPGCSSPSDSDETNTASGGGGGGGSSATTTSATSTEATSSGSTSGSTLDVVASCDMYLTAFIKPGAKNDSEQVKRLQSLLVESEGSALDISGVYDAKTVAAVHAFQTKYVADILKPWGATKSTGFVYLTTRKKVNEIYCKLTKEFPLSTEEQQMIAKTKSVIETRVSNTAPAARTVPTAPKTESATEEVGSVTKEAQTAAAGSEGATRSINRLWDPITGFFKRVFGR